MTKTAKVIATRWNTGRLYNVDGQYITAIFRNGRIVFDDETRGISGTISHTGAYLEGEEDLQRETLHYYDRELYRDDLYSLDVKQEFAVALAEIKAQTACENRQADVASLARNAALAAVDDGGDQDAVDSHWENLGSTASVELGELTPKEVDVLRATFCKMLALMGYPLTPSV